MNREVVKEAKRRRALGGESGQAMVFLTAGIGGLVFFGLMAFAVDYGSLLQVRQELQASTDAAALAGAQVLGDGDLVAITTANSFSAKGGGKNAKLAHPATMVSGFPKTKCVPSLGVPCSPNSNVIHVAQQAVAPMVFGKIIGLNEITVRADAAALGKGGGVPPLDIMFVIDITGSMSWDCNASVPGVSNPDKLDCAKAGIRVLLEELWPCSPEVGTCTSASDPVDLVGLMAFPGLEYSWLSSRHLDCSDNLTCGGSWWSYTCHYENFWSNPYYPVVSLSNDFKLSADGPLNGAGSDMVKAVDWSNGAGCPSWRYGLEVLIGGGDPVICTFFADVLEEAHWSLVNNGRPDVQDVIIFLSDGDSNDCSGMGNNQCQRAINAAASAKAAGTWIYSIAYEASSSRRRSCNTDSHLSGLDTMEAIASDPAKFFNQPYPGDLTEIFRHIAHDMTYSRLIPPSLL